jgi:DNA (cytosine-5)-methyltransferase 3A
MNVLSLFDGMSCGRIALERVGIKVDNYFSSKIKDYAIKVADINYPQDKKNRLGDITKIEGYMLPKIDLLIGGSPCQDFSGANKERLGTDGLKSKLFFVYVRLLKETNPKYFLLENVRMKKEHQDFISEVIGCEPIIINSYIFK